MDSPTEAEPRLSLFVSEEQDGFRVYAPPLSLPRQLRPFFDRYGEAFPVPALDLADLERGLANRGLSVKSQTSALGGTSLSGAGESAAYLGRWLATAFASGVRPGS